QVDGEFRCRKEREEELRELFAAELPSLSRNDREAVALFYYCGISQHEVATTRLLRRGRRDPVIACAEATAQSTRAQRGDPFRVPGRGRRGAEHRFGRRVRRTDSRHGQGGFGHGGGFERGDGPHRDGAAKPDGLQTEDRGGGPPPLGERRSRRNVGDASGARAPCAGRPAAGQTFRGEPTPGPTPRARQD